MAERRVTGKRPTVDDGERDTLPTRPSKDDKERNARTIFVGNLPVKTKVKHFLSLSFYIFLLPIHPTDTWEAVPI